MLTMILKMTAATVIYVGATVLLWHFWHKQKKHTLGMKLAVGLFFGLCSVVSSHIGIDYGDMVLNIRDLGPLAAGLFFDPLSGILSGLIGGIERYIIGEYFGIGSFTRVACSSSTILAGLLAAALNKWVYEGKRPSMIHCLFVGAEMEVYHMYAVFLTNRDDLDSAYRVVGTCALPMIIFTALGLMACSHIILRLSGQRVKNYYMSASKKITPIDLRFQRWMLLLVLVFLIFGSLLSYFQTVSSGGESASGLKREFLETLFLEILIFTALYLVTTVLVNRIIVRNLDKVNDSLSRITAGHLTETVSVEESVEFAKLSAGINSTVTALRGYIDAAEKRMEEELQLAAEIQDAALPKSFDLPAENISLHALMTPARQVGGDFYDFFYTGPDQLALVIADVSGKGIPAALFMMRAKTAIKNSAISGIAPAKVLEAVNDVLREGNDLGMFVTVWLGILDLKTGLMRCCNAGHEYPALMRAGGDYILLKGKHGPFLGVVPGIPRREYELQLESGDRLFVYTDGVPEAVNENNEQYGTARMTQHLNTLKHQPQDRLLSGMLENVRCFAGEAEQFDDITMLGITWTRPA